MTGLLSIIQNSENRALTTSPTFIKVLFISYYFPPLHHSGTIRSEAFCHYLPDHGIYPIILCGKDAAQYAASTQPVHGILPDWLDDPRWPLVRRFDWGLGSSSKNPVLSTLLQRFPICAFLVKRRWQHNTVARVLPVARKAISKESPKAIYATYLPAENLLLGQSLHYETGLPLVADLRDPWSHMPSPYYRHYIDSLLMHRVERKTLSTCSRVIVTNSEHAKLLTSELGVRQEAIRVIPNGYDERDFAHVVKSNSINRDVFVITHAGTLATLKRPSVTFKARLKRVLGLDYDPACSDYDSRSPRYLLAGVEQFIDRRPKVRDKVILEFVGIDEREASLLKSAFRYPDRLRFFPRVASQEAVQACCEANLLVLLQVRMNIRRREQYLCIPGKLYTYLRTGRPILACVNKSEISDIIERHRAGQVVGPHDVAGIAEAIEKEFDRWDRKDTVASNGRTIAEFDRRNQTQALASTFRDIVS